jgi:hypothetical protein
MKFEIYEKMGSIIKRSGFSQDPLTFISLFLIFIIGTYLRLHELGKDSLWFDEMSGIYLSMAPALSIIQNLQFPLHFLFTHFALYFGENATIVRLPSAILGTLSIPLIYLVGKNIYGKDVGLTSAFLLSISTYHIYYSQNARAYSQVVFFSLLTLLFLWKAINEKKKIWWIAGFLISTILNILTYGIALFVLIVEAAFLVYIAIANFSSIKNYFYRVSHVTLFMMGLGLISVSFIIIFRLPITEKVPFNPSVQIPGLELSIPFFIDILKKFSVVGSISPYIFGLMFLYGAAKSLKKYKPQIILIILWITLPFVVLFTVKMNHPFFDVRYIIFMLPIFLISVSHGIVSLSEKLEDLLVGYRIRKVSIISIVLIFEALSIPTLQLYYEGNYYGEKGKVDWRGASLFLKEMAKDGDIVIIRPPFVTMAFTSFYYDPTRYNISILSGSRTSYPRLFLILNKEDRNLWRERNIWVVSEDKFNIMPAMSIENETTLRGLKIYKIKIRNDTIFINMENYSEIHGWNLEEVTWDSGYYYYPRNKLYSVWTVGNPKALIKYEFYVSTEGNYDLYVNIRWDGRRGTLKYRIDDGPWSKGFLPTGPLSYKDALVGSVYLKKGTHEITFKNDFPYQKDGYQDIYYFYLISTDTS